MSHWDRFCAVSVAFVLSAAWTAVAQTGSPKPESWLLQSLYLTGTTVDGFKKTCLIVFKNGDYRREQRRQFSESGRAQYEWQAPEVFEGKLTGADLNALQAILEDQEFRAIEGGVGGGRDLGSQVAFNRQGAVIPHDNIEIMTVAVARSDAPQVFEVADFDVARRQEPLGTFLKWIKAVERSQAQRFKSSRANNCSSLVGMNGGSVGKTQTAVGITQPKAIYAPPPLAPRNIPKPEPVTVELLINPDGTVARTSLQGHPNSQAAQSVLDVVGKWKFEPARLLGVPIAKSIVLTIEFKSK
jgi:TonB family protein